ncbi:Imm52 family immunity protein [Jiangella endophytica]|uniref:Imm52 family immunity protein n=1 Tax=Jiangella endophytica TaxID=1623398 RepID=UPI000E34F707|nr:Imm52 family immunity protein [Jiangella endophytica]
MSVDEALVMRGFWGARQESAKAVADKLVAFTARLDGVVGERVSWTTRDMRSLADPLEFEQVVAAAFDENTDAPHLGASQFYDGSAKGLEAASIGMVVGGYSDSGNVKNSIVVKIRSADVERFGAAVLRAVVSEWDPDWGDVTSSSLMRALADAQPRGKPIPKMGYMTYLSEARAQALPDGLEKHLQRLDNGGVVIGSNEKDGFLTAATATELAELLRSSAAFAATPASSSKL